MKTIHKPVQLLIFISLISSPYLNKAEATEDTSLANKKAVSAEPMKSANISGKVTGDNNYIKSNILLKPNKTLEQGNVKVSIPTIEVNELQVRLQPAIETKNNQVPTTGLPNPTSFNTTINNASQTNGSQLAMTSSTAVTNIVVLPQNIVTLPSIPEGILTAADKKQLDESLEEAQLTVYPSYMHKSSAIKVTPGKLIIENKDIGSNFSLRDEQAPISPNTQSILESYINLEQTLATQVNISEYDDITIRYPLINTKNLCNSKEIGIASSDRDLSNLINITYCTDCLQSAKFYASLLTARDKYPLYVNDVIQVLTSRIAKGDKFTSIPSTTSATHGKYFLKVQRNEPLHIIHSQTRDEYQANGGKKYSDGIYIYEYNILNFLTENINDNWSQTTFIHEATHWVMNLLFQNQVQPYKENDKISYELYQNAKIKTLAMIAVKLKAGEEHHLITAEDYINFLKNDSVLDLICIASGKPDKNQIPNTDRLIRIEKKYFNGESIRQKEDLPNLLIDKCAEVAKRLGLSHDDLMVLQRIGKLIYMYEPESLDGELIVLIPQLLAEKFSEQILKEYLAPLMGYWDNIIHKLAIIEMAENVITNKTGEESI